MFWEALKRSGPELWCLCGVQGQIGRVAGSSICRQDSSPSGASCLTNLPHTHFKSTHKHRYRCCFSFPDKLLHGTQMRKQTYACQVKRIHRCAKNCFIYAHRGKLTWSFLHLFGCVLFFFSLRWFPPPQRRRKACPRGRTAVLIDSRGVWRSRSL